jgi:hypothetical protein
VAAELALKTVRQLGRAWPLATRPVCGREAVTSSRAAPSATKTKSENATNVSDMGTSMPDCMGRKL